MYDETMNEYPMLTDAEQKALARRAHAGDTKARDLLVLSNLRFVQVQVKLYCCMDPSKFSDVMQQGIAGLIHAIDKYDPDRGFSLTTYAWQWIWQSMRRGVYGSSKVYMPFYAKSGLQTVKELQLRGVTSAQDLAKESGLALDFIKILLELQQTRYLSLEQPVNAEDGSLTHGDLILDDADDYADLDDREDSRERIRKMFSVLNPRERKIMKLRFWADGDKLPSYASIGRQLHISSERVRQLIDNAMIKMRRVERLEPEEVSA